MRASAWTPCDCGADQCRVRRLEGDDVDDPAASVSLTDGAWLWRMRRADRRFEWGTVDLEAAVRPSPSVTCASARTASSFSPL